MLSCLVDMGSCGILYVLLFCFFFFKQKTAYEMRMSDWSSDVCSSDLVLRRDRILHVDRRQLEAVELGRIEPDAHRILRAEYLIVADAGREIGRASCRERVCQYV